MSKRVLICDDSTMARRMVADSLIEDGWEVVGEATNGQEAVDLYKETRPDVVTMDLIMSGTDGLTGLEGIREFDPEAKIVVISSVAQKEIVSEAIRCGAHDFIAKPFVPEQLQQSMAGCVA